jgi:UDP-2,3-diacylglucosamine pyrophosphatase LpxH
MQDSDPLLNCFPQSSESSSSLYQEERSYQDEQSDSEIHATRTIRSMFLSDIHLGSKFSYADELLTYLNEHQPERIYFVGDLIDGRKLSSKWRWPHTYTQLMDRIFKFGHQGTRVFYLPGNHDEFMRLWQEYFGYEILKSLPITIVDEMMHVSPDGRKFLVTHGDQFDHHECRAGLVSKLTCLVYDWILWGTRTAQRYLPTAYPERYSLAQSIKANSTTLRKFTAGFRKHAVNYARQKHCDGIICGHIHQPMIETQDKITYCNTGDWVEHCTALVEYSTGEFDLVYFDDWLKSQNN